jgi:hypothetical protein
MISFNIILILVNKCSVIVRNDHNDIIKKGRLWGCVRYFPFGGVACTIETHGSPPAVPLLAE